MDVKIFNVWGVNIINTTPHPITFGKEGSDETIAVPPSGVLINAKASEKNVPRPKALRDAKVPVRCVRTGFIADQEGRDILDSIPPDTVVVGSIIAAQAYPGRVFGLVPCQGYERVPPAEKRMRHDKFNIF